jgi:hypothetical protein
LFYFFLAVLEKLHHRVPAKEFLQILYPARRTITAPGPGRFSGQTQTFFPPKRRRYFSVGETPALL